MAGLSDFFSWLNAGKGLTNLGAGAAHGNPGQAVGGTLQAGSNLANLGGFSDVGNALGGLGGPLSLISNLASGNYGGAALAAPGAVAGSLGAAGAAGAALPASLAALEGVAGAVAPYMALLLPAIYDTGGNDFFDSLFGGEKSHAQKQHEEFQSYMDAFPGLAQRRLAGASLFDTLGGNWSPESLKNALETAVSGMRANPEPTAWNISHSPNVSHDKPVDLTGWNAVAPELGARNGAAFAHLMDAGQKAGLNIGGIAGKDWSLDPAGNTTTQEYQTREGAPQNSWDRAQTEEAQDVGNVLSGVGADLGLDLNHRADPTTGNVGDYGNFDESSLAQYGLTPGNYGLGIMNYLRSFDPAIVNHPKWAEFTNVLGDPSSMTPLQLQPRQPTFTAPSPDMNAPGAP